MDWYEADVDLDGERVAVQVFAMHSMESGAAFHRAYRRRRKASEASDRFRRRCDGVMDHPPLRRWRHDVTRTPSRPSLEELAGRTLSSSERSGCVRSR